VLHGLRPIQVARKGPCSGQSLASTVMLEATRRPLSSDMACTHRGGLVRLQ